MSDRTRELCVLGMFTALYVGIAVEAYVHRGKKNG